jgi:hypothetical protein
MFHCIPEPLIQDRVFHILVLTAHSQYILPGTGRSKINSQSHTVQLPIDIKSFREVNVMMQRSHVEQGAHRYTGPGGLLTEHNTSIEQNASTERQQRRKGNNLTEGSYVSVERLRPAISNDQPVSKLQRTTCM